MAVRAGTKGLPLRTVHLSAHILTFHRAVCTRRPTGKEHLKPWWDLVSLETESGLPPRVGLIGMDMAECEGIGQRWRPEGKTRKGY